MRRPDQLVHSRARVRPRYALMPLEGFPTSRLASCPDAEVRVLAAPAIGAGFVQYLLDIPPGKQGGFHPDDRLETFAYLLSGHIEFGCGGQKSGGGEMKPGSYGLFTPADGFVYLTREPSRLLILRKVFEREPYAGNAARVVGQDSTVPAEPYADNPHAHLQTLIPDDLAYDLAMNIFTFDPGHGLPYVETHVMEHGLLVLEGKGLYYLDGEWMEVEKDDFIWMGPYCPQSFVATGPTPAKYIYYKNVNREILL
jgi:(S)-ureidoglycine aminohydrolase